MEEKKSYENWAREHAEAMIKIGVQDPAALRELLICTTISTVAPSVMEYFKGKLADSTLLKNLFSIALEGEDCGDAPWAAANVITEFPSSMLEGYKLQLQELASYQWSYLKIPAEIALSKISKST